MSSSAFSDPDDYFSSSRMSFGDHLEELPDREGGFAYDRVAECNDIPRPGLGASMGKSCHGIAPDDRVFAGHLGQSGEFADLSRQRIGDMPHLARNTVGGKLAPLPSGKRNFARE